jgi:hypothetical protein
MTHHHRQSRYALKPPARVAKNIIKQVCIENVPSRGMHLHH